MFDLWYAIGATIMSPVILDNINDQAEQAAQGNGQLFYPIPLIRFCDGDDNEQHKIITNPNDPTSAPLKIQDSGFINSKIIDQVRQIVTKEVHNLFPAAPPISLYTAGKFCQFIKVPAFNFKANIQLAKQGYDAAISENPRRQLSPNFPALMGVLVMDSRLSASLSGEAGSSSDGSQALSEFGVTNSHEISVLRMLAKSSGPFSQARSNLLGDASEESTTWGSCAEQFRGWSLHTDGMVI